MSRISFKMRAFYCTRKLGRHQRRARSHTPGGRSRIAVPTTACYDGDGSSNPLSVNGLQRTECAESSAGAARQLLIPNASVPQPGIVRDVLPNWLRLLTERMPHVRSVSIGVWLARGSRHESQEQSGIAHFVEHMLFKGTST